VNHLMFVDDIYVFRPSATGLQCLLKICGDYVAEHESIFNCNKNWRFFAPKLQTTCSMKYFSNYRTYTRFWRSEIPWWVVKCISEGWWWYSDTVKSLYREAKKLRGIFDQRSPAVKNTLFRAC